jgi:hypothetical protein
MIAYYAQGASIHPLKVPFRLTPARTAVLANFCPLKAMTKKRTVSCAQREHFQLLWVRIVQVRVLVVLLANFRFRQALLLTPPVRSVLPGNIRPLQGMTLQRIAYRVLQASTQMLRDWHRTSAMIALQEHICHLPEAQVWRIA